MKKPQPDIFQRYVEIKKLHPGTLLLFRNGDFYEAYFEDAEMISRYLGLTRTTYNKTGPNPVPMCGFPHYQISDYLNKLKQLGYRVAAATEVDQKWISEIQP